MIDPITLRIIANRLVNITREMSVTIVRTSYSTIIREIYDFSPVIFDNKGRLVAQSEGMPIHLGGMHYIARDIEKAFGTNIHEGDMFITNHPYLAHGHHCFDIYVASPIFDRNGKRVCMAASFAHHLDMGGIGGFGELKDVYYMGLLLPILKLYEGGVCNEAIARIIETNSRTPDLSRGDLNAQVAANRVAERRIKELLEKYGRDLLLKSFEEILNQSERIMRLGISELRDGTYSFEDFLDDDGSGRDRSLRLKAAVTKKADAITVDFAGTSESAGGAVNSPYSITCSGVYYAVRSYVGCEAMQNEGCYRPITVIAPEGTIVNPLPPAAPHASDLCNRIADVVIGALQQAGSRERMVSAPSGVVTAYYIQGFYEGKYYKFYDNANEGGMNAHHKTDGINAMVSDVVNTTNNPIESLEMLFPIRFLSYELVTDSGGPGKYRGGLGTRRKFAFLGDTAVFAGISERLKFSPWGILGGKHGRKGKVIINPGTKGEKKFYSAFFGPLFCNRGDVFLIEVAGGGGVEYCWERDPEKVLTDVKLGYVSFESALNDYEVAIDKKTLTIDHQKTKSLRARTHKKEGEIGCIS